MTAGYFQALKIGLVRGRLLKELAQLGDPAPREIVGVVRDVRENGVHREAPAILYLPPGQVPAPFATMRVRMLPQSFIVRTPGDTTPFATSVPREIQAVNSLAAGDEHPTSSFAPAYPPSA